MHTLSADLSGERLDVFIARTIPDCSRATAQRLIAERSVAVDGCLAEKSSQKLAEGVAVTVAVPTPRQSPLTPESMELDIIYEDGDLIVVNKPSGIVVHPSAGHESGTMVHALLAYSHDLSGIGGEERPGIVHRLDRDTSGLLIVAKNDRSHRSLSHQLQAHTTGKYYLALLQGTPKPRTGIIDAPLGRDPFNRQKMAIVGRGKPARTRYLALAEAAGTTLVVAGLETGRTHQLRVHFAGIGCPIAGDPIYGAPGGPAGRLWLHAWRLGFNRPGDGERLVVEAPLPPGLASSWTREAGRGAGEAPTLEVLLERARRWAVDPPPSTDQGEHP